MIGDKKYSPMGKERRSVGADAEKKRGKAAREQET